jgi:hypothetical protein
MRNCRNCGAEARAGMASCRYCGTAYPAPVHATPVSAPPTSKPRESPPVSVLPKSRSAAAILAFLFGWLGFHNFYLGHDARGFIQLLLSCTVVGLFLTVPWSFLEGAMILSGRIRTDAKGVRLDP